jgi:NAD(P)-dependent dehydrogenase (short-subunit alcohol dehydrogenase family)
VVVNYASSKGADRVVDKITKQGGKAIAARANMAKKAEIERLFSETEKAFGRLDILVNNAGVYEFLPLEKITEEHFHRHFDINVLGLLLAIQEATNYFGPEGGSVINISSSASSSAPAVASVYSATKAAVDTITKSLAKELGPRKIRVNAINPGMVATEGQRANGQAGFSEAIFRRCLSHAARWGGLVNQTTSLRLSFSLLHRMPIGSRAKHCSSQAAMANAGNRSLNDSCWLPLRLESGKGCWRGVN